MSELWQSSALELAEKIRTGEATSREVLQAHIDRVEAVNGLVGTITPIDPVTG